jgi:hypothetical protein
MLRALAIVAVCAGVAHADGAANDSFEAHAQTARRVHRIENLVWALTATCTTGDDAQQRQCRHARDAEQAELAHQTLLVEADAEAFDVGTWAASTKTVPFSITACIRCLGVDVDGATWYVVGTGAQRSFRNDMLVGGPIKSDARAFRDDAEAAAWSRAVGNARVEMVVKVPASARWRDAGKNGLALDIVAWRVIAPCDGAIVAANPPSGPVAADKSRCVPPPPAPQDTIAELSPSAIMDAMKPVVDAAQVCFARLAVTGTAHLHLRVLPDGTVGRYEQQGDFVNTPMGACIDKAAAKLAFPASKQGITIVFPIKVSP